jgi:hypothetical protein
VPDRADDRCVSKSGTFTWSAQSGDDDRARGTGSIGQLLDEAALADAGVAADEHRASARVVERGECAGQDMKLGFSTGKHVR